MPFDTKKLRDLLGCNDLCRIFAGEEAVVRAPHKALPPSADPQNVTAYEKDITPHILSLRRDADSSYGSPSRRNRRGPGNRTDGGPVFKHSHQTRWQPIGR